MKKQFIWYVMLWLLCASFRQDRSAFYKALSSKSEDLIDQQLELLEKGKPTSQNLVFEGALLMKKASFQKAANNKVKMFKKGARQLEAEIEKSPSNVEYRFIRLTIQENAPGILKYNKKIDEDKYMVINGYQKLEGELRSIILDYSKSSRILKEPDLKGN
jgi:hypothetical protein